MLSLDLKLKGSSISQNPILSLIENKIIKNEKLQLYIIIVMKNNQGKHHFHHLVPNLNNLIILLKKHKYSFH